MVFLHKNTIFCRSVTDELRLSEPVRLSEQQCRIKLIFRSHVRLSELLAWRLA